MPIDGSSITQFAAEVLSPCPDGAVGFQRQNMPPARRDGGDVRHAGNLDRDQALRIRPGTQFPARSRAPGPDRAVGQERHAIGEAAGNLSWIIHRVTRRQSQVLMSFRRTVIKAEAAWVQGHRRSFGRQRVGLRIELAPTDG